MKYGKPIWQLVEEAADNLEKGVFRASDIIEGLYKINSAVPGISIRTYVIAMAPNHPTSHHYRVTREKHPYFYYLGNGKFRLLKPNEFSFKATLKNPPSKPLEQDKNAFINTNRDLIVSWANKHQAEIIEG